MKQILRAMCVIVLTMLSGLEASRAEEADDAAQSLSEYKDLDAFVNTVVATQRSLLDISAMTVSIVKDGKVILAKAYGMQDIEQQIPATAGKSTFRIGSTSKLFTWTAVMQQVERGNLDLDADVNTYLTTFQIPETYEEPITLRHILTHTAGFEDGALGYLLDYDADISLPLQAAMAKYIPKRVNKPGAYSAYSNYGAALAGLIVQNVSGLPFADYIRQNILEPLGMEHSTFLEPLPEGIIEGRTVGYAREMGGQEAQPFEIITSFAPAGSMSSTAEDMAQFMIMHLNNGRFGDARVLKEETAKQMHSVLFQADERLPGMAYGFYEEFLNGHKLIGHGGDTMQFHTNLMLDQAEQLGIFVSYATEEGYAGRNQFIKSFYDHYYPKEMSPVAPPADFDDRAGDYAGEYKFWRQNFSTIERAVGILGGGITVAPTGKKTLMVGGAMKPRQYVEVGQDLFRQVDGDGMLAFGRNADGEVHDLYFDFMPFIALSRAHAFEGMTFTMLLPGICVLIMISVLTGWIYRRKEYRAMGREERMAIRFSIGVAGVNLLYLIALGIIIASYGASLYESIPTIFGVNQTLTVVSVLLMLGVVWCAVRAWQSGHWTMARRIHYSLVAMAALYLTLFYHYWHIIGWQYF